MSSFETLPLDVALRSPAPAALAALPLVEKVAALRRCELRGITVVLRPYEFSDCEDLRLLRNQPNNQINLAQTSDLTAAQQRAWSEAYLARTDDLCWTLRTIAGEFAGAISLYDIQPRSAETGRLVLREELARSSPILAESELMMQWLAFGWLRLERVLARVQPTNAKMVTMHERLGFTITGPTAIRGIPYLQLEIAASAFRPDAHLRVLEHWRRRAAAAAPAKSQP